MKAKVILNDAPLCSKQHSSKRGWSGKHMMYTDGKYAAAKKAFHWMARSALVKQGWTRPVECYCALRISYRANRMNVDNVQGFIMDALEGAAYLKDGQVDIVHVRKRRTGPPWVGLYIRTLEAKHG